MCTYFTQVGSNAIRLLKSTYPLVGTLLEATFTSKKTCPLTVAKMWVFVSSKCKLWNHDVLGCTLLLLLLRRFKRAYLRVVSGLALASEPV